MRAKAIFLGGIGVWSHSVEAMETQCVTRDQVS